MGVIENAREVADLVQKIGNLDLYRRIVELQGEIVSLSEEKLKCEQENAEMRRILDLRQAMKFRFPYYYQDGDPNPFCRLCWEAKGIAVHLDHGRPWQPGGIQRYCHSCGKAYYDQPH